METMNHEYYVSSEVAKLLKEAGFNWECRKIYYEDDGKWEFEDNYKKIWRLMELDYCLLAPTLEVAQRWLREVNKFHIDIQIMDIDNIKYGFYLYEIYEEKNPEIPFNNDMLHFVPFGLICKGKSDKLFNTYEEAKEEGIKKALEIILEKGE